MPTVLKIMSPKHNIYVVNQNLEHVDDVSFRELFGRMGVSFFYKIRFVPSLDEVFVSTRTLAIFVVKRSWTNSFNLSFSFEFE